MSSTRSQAAACSALVLTLAALAAGPGFAQSAAPAAAGNPESQAVLRGKLERVKVHGKSLEGNLMGESASPEVSIYLPPSYATDPNRHYPVVYLLHGYTGTDLSYFGPTGRQLHLIAERVFRECGARDDSRDAERDERVRRQHVLQLGDRRRLGRVRR